MINYVGRKIKIHKDKTEIGTITGFDYKYLDCVVEVKSKDKYAVKSYKTSFYFKTAYESGILEFLDQDLKDDYQQYQLRLQQEEENNEKIEIEEYKKLSIEHKELWDKYCVLESKRRIFRKLFGEKFKYKPFYDFKRIYARRSERYYELAKKYKDKVI